MAPYPGLGNATSSWLVVRRCSWRAAAASARSRRAVSQRNSPAATRPARRRRHGVRDGVARRSIVSQPDCRAPATTRNGASNANGPTLAALTIVTPTDTAGLLGR
jgi:hypothetical protein